MLRRGGRRAAGVAGLYIVLRAAAPCLAVAGPAVPEEALSGYTGPLERLGSKPAAGNAASADAEGAPSADAPLPEASEAPVTIIGAPGVDPLNRETAEDPLAAQRNRFLGTPQRGARPIPVAAEGGAPGESVSFGAIARSLINTIPAGGSQSGGEGPRPAGGGPDGQSFFGDALAELIVDLLDPAITAEGLVTFSIAGFGSFALLLSEETGSIFFVDLERSTAIKVFEHVQNRTLQDFNRTGIGAASGTTTAHGSSGAFQRALRFLEQNVYPLLTSPITLAAFALFSIIWLVWRISARPA